MYGPPEENIGPAMHRIHKHLGGKHRDRVTEQGDSFPTTCSRKILSFCMSNFAAPTILTAAFFLVFATVTSEISDNLQSRELRVANLR